MLDQQFEFNGQEYRAVEKMVLGKLSGKIGKELQLYRGDENITWSFDDPPIPDDIKAGDSAIIKMSGWRDVTHQVVTVTRVTKTQIVTSDERRWIRRNGREHGQSASYSRIWRRLVGYNEDFLAWRMAREIQDEYNKSEEEKREDAIKAIKGLLPKATLEQLRQALLALGGDE